MAAIFCESLCKPCEWIGQCLSCCCRGFGQCCSSCCKSFGECCGNCCESISNVCNSCCNWINRACKCIFEFLDNLFIRPFSCCLLFTVAINLAPFILTLMAFSTFATDCEKPLHIWLIVSVILYVLNITFGGYVYKSADRHGVGNTAFERAKQFFLYDVGVCLYIVVAIFMFAWAIVGFNWSMESSRNPGCNAHFITTTNIAAILLLCFFAIGLALIFCSLTMSFMEYCIEDCNLFKCLFCCIYYPFCYEGAPSGWKSRAERAEESRGAALHNPPSYSPPASNYMQPQRPQEPMQAFVNVTAAQPILAQRPVVVSPYATGTPLPVQSVIYAQPVQHVSSPPSYEQYPSPPVYSRQPNQPEYYFAQPVQPSVQPIPKKPAESKLVSDETVEAAAAVAALGAAAAIGLGKMAWGAGKAAAAEAAKIYDEEQKKQNVPPPRR